MLSAEDVCSDADANSDMRTLNYTAEVCLQASRICFHRPSKKKSMRLTDNASEERSKILADVTCQRAHLSN